MTTQEYRNTARQIGCKIKAARQKVYRRALDAHAAMSKHTTISLNSLQKHESGARRPSERLIKLYAKLYKTSVGTLLPDTVKVTPDTTRVNAEVNSQPVKVNKQLPDKADSFSFVIPQIRHIPVFTQEEIGRYVQERMPMSQVPNHTLPLPAQMAAGPQAFAYEMPMDDRSMVNDTVPSIGPGTICIVDPDREVKPGDFVLVSGGGGLMTVRMLQADSDFAPGAPFTLVALNKLYFPTRDAQSTWQIVGRVIGLHIVM